MAATFVTSGKKIIAIGRNYVKHIKELNSETPTEPFFFLKPTTSYLGNDGVVEIPRNVNLHHEVELGVVIGEKAKDVTAKNAMNHVAGYALAVDMTARNMQESVKAKGLPWTAAKGFDTFCPVGNFIPKAAIKDPHNLELYINVNGETKQRGSTADMITRIPELIQHCSAIMTLEEGDLILTGTPHGVGPLVDSDSFIAGLLDLGADKKELARLSGRVKARTDGYIFNA